jgi:hypothetical protein
MTSPCHNSVACVTFSLFVYQSLLIYDFLYTIQSLFLALALPTFLSPGHSESLSRWIFKLCYFMASQLGFVSILSMHVISGKIFLLLSQNEASAFILWVWRHQPRFFLFCFPLQPRSSRLLVWMRTRENKNMFCSHHTSLLAS